MKYTRWISLWALLMIAFTIGVGLFNYYTDPYGLHSYENKYMSDISSNTDAKINMKLTKKADYYLIGTSRLIRIDPNIPERLLKKRVYNIGISAASFKENLLLASEVKSINKNFIFGFDAFSLNQTSHENKHYKKRMKNLITGLKKPTIAYYFTNRYFIDSMRKTIKSLRGQDLYEPYKVENRLLYDNTLHEVYEKKGFSQQKGLKGAFTNYKVYDDASIIKLAKLANENDIFVIYPQHYYYYLLFHNYQNIEEQYQHALRKLVENTKAKVWTFYLINNTVKDFKNFDSYGWHFKPKLVEQIFSTILKKTETKNFLALQLSEKNIDQYFEKLKYDIHEEEKNLKITFKNLQ